MPPPTMTTSDFEPERAPLQKELLPEAAEVVNARAETEDETEEDETEDETAAQATDGAAWEMLMGAVTRLVRLHTLPRPHHGRCPHHTGQSPSDIEGH